MYGGVRSPKDMIERLEDACYTVDTDRYDQGGDFIYAYYDNTWRVSINTVSGRFTVAQRDGAVVATESSEELDDDLWYIELCYCLYRPRADAEVHS